MFETVEVDDRGAVVWITLNRPEVRNAFNSVMIRELTDYFRGLASNDVARVVVLRGRGRVFSGGADISWMRASLDFTREENAEDARRMSDMFASIEAAPQVVVGAVHGAALGGGMGLLACCDVVVAAEDAVFGFTESKLGIIPAVISRFVIPKIGVSWSRALFPSGERFGTETAQRIQLVHWVVRQDQLEERVAAVVREVLSAGPDAARAAKRLVTDVLACAPDDVRDFTVERIASIRTSPEGQEGLRAFLEKRGPSWSDDG